MNTTKNLYQWDVNQRLIDVAGKYVDFPINNEIYRVEVTDGECMIPDEVLQSSGRIKIYECMADGTLREFVFDVTERPQPPDYVYTPTERLTFNGLVQKVDDAVANMENRAAAGEFNGADGHTPVKGTDYFTESEIRQIQNEVSDGAIGELKNTVDSETKKFNDNATEKVNAYNQNAQDKLASYNQNATDKTADYNANADSKLSEYNTNVDNKVAEFNLETGKIQTSIKELSQLKPSETPTVGKVLKVLSVNEDGTFNCVWADDGGGAVDDVQINGESIVADGVADIPKATNKTAGVIKVGYGLQAMSDGSVRTASSNDAQLRARTEAYNIISPYNFDRMLKYGMCDGKGAEWTAEEQAMARVRMGSLAVEYKTAFESTLEEAVRRLTIDFEGAYDEARITVYMTDSSLSFGAIPYFRFNSNQTKAFYLGALNSKHMVGLCTNTVTYGLFKANLTEYTTGYVMFDGAKKTDDKLTSLIIDGNGSDFPAGMYVKVEVR